jgi:acetyl-CoA carboxylase beta subunit
MTPSGKPRLSTTLPTLLNIIGTTQHKKDLISAKDKKAEVYINRKVWQKCPGKVLSVLTTSVEISLEMLSFRKNQCRFNCLTRKTKLFDQERRQLPRKKTKSSQSLPDRLFTL